MTPQLLLLPADYCSSQGVSLTLHGAATIRDINGLPLLKKTLFRYETWPVLTVGKIKISETKVNKLLLPYNVFKSKRLSFKRIFIFIFIFITAAAKVFH